MLKKEVTVFKILVLSEIGLIVREELEKHGFNAISDLSGGKNLQTHVSTHVSTHGLIISLNFASTNENNSIKEENTSYYEMTHNGLLNATGTTFCSVFLQAILQHENVVCFVQLLFIGSNQEDKRPRMKLPTILSNHYLITTL